jgi:hypothetical protein
MSQPTSLVGMHFFGTMNWHGVQDTLWIYAVQSGKDQPWHILFNVRGVNRDFHVNLVGATTVIIETQVKEYLAGNILTCPPEELILVGSWAAKAQ